MGKRDDLMNTALILFYTRGFHATGIDDILAQSGTAKATLYHHFRSKDELVDAVLARQDEWFCRWIESRTADAADPADRVLALFDVMGHWFGKAGFRGCLFINAASEFDDPTAPVRRTVAAHKARVREFIHAQLRAAHCRDADVLAAQIAILLEGAIVSANIHGSPEAATHARAAAKTLLAAALPAKRSKRRSTSLQRTTS